MPRTIINIGVDDKRWLDRQARRRRVPMTQMVREAVRDYRARSEAVESRDLQGALARTAGIWRGGNGLAHQRDLRKEWDRYA